jgi:preprotein translocase subunit SecY
MFEVFRNAWKIADLRKKILYTLFIIVVFRLGSQIFVPFLDPQKIQLMIGDDGTLFNFFNNITGGALGNGSILAMSITPYINASIIMQLLSVAIPPLERLSKEGEEGRKKINKIKKLLAIGIATFQSIMFYIAIRNNGGVNPNYMNGFNGILAGTAIVLCFIAGASVVVWLGEQINDKGIGNGISMILFAGIVSRLPDNIAGLINQMLAGGEQTDITKLVLVPFILLVYVAMIALVVLMTNAERRIPVQYAKRVVGRKMYGGQSTHIPIKVAMSGVMPIIFAMSIMSLPSTIGQLFGVDGRGEGLGHSIVRLFHTNGMLYMTLYFFLIIMFNYFYVAIQYNPIEIANNLKKNNGAIPGYRPGKPTSDFIQNSLSKITLIGAIFLAFIAIFPILFSNITGITGLSMGGTSLLILVGVALETVRSLESQMMMRHHKGFLE